MRLCGYEEAKQEVTGATLFQAPLSNHRDWVVAIDTSRLLVRVPGNRVLDLPFADIEAAGTGGFRVTYPGNPHAQPPEPDTSRLASALVLYCFDRVPLDELKHQLPEQTWWDPAGRHVWTHYRHGLLIEWDGLEPGVSQALELVRAPRAKGELEVPVRPDAHAPAPPKDRDQVMAVLLTLAGALCLWRCSTDDGQDQARLAQEKLRGRPVLERQGARDIEWGGRVWDTRGRSQLGCVSFAAKRLERREGGRYCELNGGDAYVVWSADRVAP